MNEAPVRFDDILDDSKAKSRPSRGSPPRSRFIRFIEPFEDIRQILLRDTVSFISYFKFNETARRSIVT